jgi:ribose transport system substrate-binding protein
MKKVKVFGILLVLIMLVSAFLFAEGQKEGAKEKEKMVVLLMIGMESPYCPPYVSNFTTKLNEAGVKTFMFNGKFDAQLQASQMDDAIAMRPSLIVLFAADSQAIAPGIKKAHDAGVPVLMSNNRPVEESEEYVLGYVGPDYYTQGKLAAEMMNKLLGGSGDVVMIEGLAGQEAQINRANGFLENVDGGIKLLARQPADWRKDKAIQVMQDFITRYGDEIDAVYGQDDTLGIGAAIAMEEAGIDQGAIPVISIGGSREGLKAVSDGVIYGTVMQSPVVETDGLVPVVLDVLDEGLTAGDHLDPFWQFMDMPKVTADNVEGYLPGDW